MKNKILAIIMITFLLLFEINIKKVQANPIALAAEAVTFIAAAMVAAGAVGTYIPGDADNPATGTLGTEAQIIFDGFTAPMKYELQQKLESAKYKGYMLISSVTGLYDALHTAFTASEIIPQGYDDYSNYFVDGTLLSLNVSGSYTELGGGLYRYPKCNIRMNGDSFVSGIVGTFVTNSHLVVQTFETDSTWAGLISFIASSGKVDMVVSGSVGTGFSVPGSINDGSSARPISIPLYPGDLSNATPQTQYPTTGGYPSTPVTSPDGIQTGDSNPIPDPDALAAAAAAAAAAAYAAAVAAGQGQAAAQAAAAAASAAINAGQNAAAAAAAGAAAAAAAATTTIEGWLSDIWTTITEWIWGEATTVPVNPTAPILDNLTTPLQIDLFENTMGKLNNFDTSKGQAPKITIPLNRMVNCFTSITGISNPFAQDEYVLVDFAYFDSISFGGLSVIDYFRSIIGFGFILNTFLYCYRKIHSGSVIH